MRKSCFKKSEVFDVLDYLKEKKFTAVSFSGGEPTLNPNLESFIERARGITRVNISTNGHWGDHPEKLKKFKGLGIKKVGLSLDGFNETHDKIRGQKGLYDKIWNIVEEAKAAKPGTIPIVKINLTAMPENVPEIYGLVKYLTSELDNKRFRMYLAYVSRYGRAANMVLSDKQIKVVSRAREKLREWGTKKIDPETYPYKYSFSDYKENVHGRCDHFKSLYISSCGNVYVCRHSFIPYTLSIGNFRKQPMESIVSGYDQSEFHKIMIENGVKEKFLHEIEDSRYEGMKWANTCLPCSILNTYIFFRLKGYDIDHSNGFTEKVTKGRTKGLPDLKILQN
jgi:MoaA/NifB/PqqE/SkfB family radical SAM enzyme